MKKWTKAEINCVELSATEQKISLDLVYDGGYIGDGKFGWFGGSENGGSCNPQPPCPDQPSTPTPDPVNPTNTDLLS